MNTLHCKSNSKAFWKDDINPICSGFRLGRQDAYCDQLGYFFLCASALQLLKHNADMRSAAVHYKPRGRFPHSILPRSQWRFPHSILPRSQWRFPHSILPRSQWRFHTASSLDHSAVLSPLCGHVCVIVSPCACVSGWLWPGRQPAVSVLFLFLNTLPQKMVNCLYGQQPWTSANSLLTLCLSLSLSLSLSNTHTPSATCVASVMVWCFFLSSAEQIHLHVNVKAKIETNVWKTDSQCQRSFSKTCNPSVGKSISNRTVASTGDDTMLNSPGGDLTRLISLCGISIRAGGVQMLQQHPHRSENWCPLMLRVQGFAAGRREGLKNWADWI